MLQHVERGSLPVQKEEKYLTSYWETRVRSEMQVQLLVAMTPRTVPREKRDDWQLAWLKRYALPFSKRLNADPQRFVRIAKRIEKGLSYSPRQLKLIALELENY